MAYKKKLGKAGEAKAAAFLKREGYRIIAKNYQCRIGELDIIAMDGDILVAIEVKTRSNLSYGLPCQSITPAKRMKIVGTFRYFLLVNQIEDLDIRIDVIEILSTGDGDFINHIKGAI